MKVKQKEIVLLPYPFTNLRETKVRPAIIISNDHFNEKLDDCIMIPLTSVIKDEPYSVLVSQEDLSSGELIRPSRVRADRIFTVEKNLVIMKIGTVNNSIFDKIKSELLKMF